LVDTGGGKAAPLLLSPVGDSVATPTESRQQNTIDKQQEQPVVVKIAAPTVDDRDAYPIGVFTINHRKVIYARAGSSLLAIAKKNNVKLPSLLQYNELAKQKVLKEDRLIFLQLKPSTGEHEYNVAAHNETIDEVAQAEGVRLESLLEYNHLRAGAKLAAGKKIYLQPGKSKSLRVVKPSRVVKTSKSGTSHPVTKNKKHKGHKA